eukprot:TRINITY_DN562_c0_g1_i1.p1 TRINITY_DN562_c0_g1~~TRINITY_DN562_c0_g1_i1.p1  ORF type:complete len:277 (-),score=149.30 TRINITY_DN562_c0_g1_i1:624-1454(-)
MATPMTVVDDDDDGDEVEVETGQGGSVAAPPAATAAAAVNNTMGVGAAAPLPSAQPAAAAVAAAALPAQLPAPQFRPAAAGAPPPPQQMLPQHILQRPLGTPVPSQGAQLAAQVPPQAAPPPAAAVRPPVQQPPPPQQQVVALPPPRPLPPTIAQQRQREAGFMKFLKALDDYAPTVPVAVTQHYLQRGGAGTTDPRILKLVSLAADRFMACAVYDATVFQMARLEAQRPARAARGRDAAAAADECLQMCDLAGCLHERGIMVHEYECLEQDHAKR